LKKENGKIDLILDTVSADH
jgi:D-arabinose 1-dehydrogenase-like Zn-dependent alcohol dehydrogenase